MKTIQKVLVAVISSLVLVLAIPVIPSTIMGTVTVEAAVQKINKKKLTMKKGEKKKLKIIGAKKAVKWKSSNKKVASVSKKGMVKAKKKGTAVITAKTGKKRFRCKVKVKNSLPKVTPTVKPTKTPDNTSEVKPTVKPEEVQIEITDISLDKSDLSMLEGETAQLSGSIYPENTTQSRTIIWSSNKESVATVSSDGKVTAVAPGMATITARTSNNKKAKCIVTVTEPVKAANVCGFYLSTYSQNDTAKVTRCNSRNSDGSNTYSAEFYCDGNEKWLDTLMFQVEDVTPTAYKNMFSDMDVPYGEINMDIFSAASRIQEGIRYGCPMKVLEPFDETGIGDRDVEATGGKILKISAPMGARALKISAVLDGEVLDYIYVVSSGIGAEGNYVQADLDLYKAVRGKVEEQIWTSDMTNAEKLAAMADYINKTTHYPGTDTVSREYNPTFWADWAVDDCNLFWSMANDAILNRIMDLQGGIVTCQASSILERVAIEDMGLPYLYDSETDTIADGEGIWVGIGSYSSAPYNPWHETLRYKDSAETRMPLDAQGMSYHVGSEMVTCEGHGCKDYIIPLK